MCADESLPGFTVEHGGDLLANTTAVFNPGPQRRYRYLLTHQWGSAAAVVFCMLNPSTADAFTPDPTITRCLDFARRQAAGGLIVINLFALRATDPRVLARHPDPVGPANDWFLDTYATPGRIVIAAWGAHPFAQPRATAVTARLRERGVRLRCLATTKSGAPGHPLYLPKTAPLLDYAPVG